MAIVPEPSPSKKEPKIRIINREGSGEIQYDIIPPDKENLTDEVAKIIEIGKRFKK